MTRSGVDSPFWYGCDFRDLNPGGIVVANGDIIIDVYEELLMLVLVAIPSV